MVNTSKKLYGLIGRSIGHSLSAKYFNSKFHKEGINAEYRLFDLPDISGLTQIIMDNPALVGLNVTSPYKREVIAFLDDITEEAESLGAVNVIKIQRTGEQIKLYGHNTDSAGFLKSIELLPAHSKALLLGTGGAASAVASALTKKEISFLKVSRQPQDGSISYNQCNALIPKYDIIINATPVGMFPHTEDLPPIDFNKISSRHLCYDLIYNPPKTNFLSMSEQRGAKIINGMQMLLNQAEGAWEIWNS